MRSRSGAGRGGLHATGHLTFKQPSVLSSRLSGFMSRCAMPALWMKAKPLWVRRGEAQRQGLAITDGISQAWQCRGVGTGMGHMCGRDGAKVRQGWGTCAAGMGHMCGRDGVPKRARHQVGWLSSLNSSFWGCTTQHLPPIVNTIVNTIQPSHPSSTLV